MTTTRATRFLTLMTLMLILALVEGCAHRRQTYYGSDIGPSQGVHVRAPFVDVQVNPGPKAQKNEPRLSRRDRDDDDDHERDDD